MIVEILGAKMLAPYVGTSHFVWTAQIAVTLAALSTGYYLGGMMADRLPRPGPMYGAILGASAYLGLTVLIVEPVAYKCLQANLAVGSLLASTFLFFVPLALLAMTAPYFVRVLTVSVAAVGENVGRLTAIGTAGSLIGTILIGYVLIPYQPNSLTMYETAGVLMGVAVIYFLIWGRLRALGGVAAAVGAILTITLGGAGVEQDSEPRFTGYEQLFRGNSNFGQMRVIRSHDDGRRFYLNDFLTQNTYDPATGQSTSLFTYMLRGLARVYTPRIDSALCIGMGAGIVPMELARQGVKVDVVEINPAVAPMSEQFFGLDPKQIHIITGDGRPYVNSTAQRYDAIILDAFLGDSTPSHLMSREAFAGMRRILNPGGVLVINAFCEFEEGKDFFAGSLDKTLKSVFKNVRIHSGNGNVFFVASDQTKLEFLHEPEFESVHPRVRGQVEAAYYDVREVNANSGIVLTDDYNPIEYYDAANREDYRRYTAMAMKKK